MDDFAALKAQLDSLTGDALHAAERRALRRVGGIVRAAIKRRAPSQAGEATHGLLKAGELSVSITARVHVATDKSTVDGDVSHVDIGPGTKIAKTVANWVENGHVKRRSKKKEGPAGFVKAEPFVRPAFDETEQEAIDAYTEEMTAAVTEAMK
jgi:HK97 gp10 family phage protein